MPRLLSTRSVAATHYLARLEPLTRSPRGASPDHPNDYDQHPRPAGPARSRGASPCSASATGTRPTAWRGRCPSIREAQLVGAAWHDRAQLEAFARTFGVQRVRRLRRAARAGRCGHRAHCGAGLPRFPDLTIRAARAGKHIVLGKPMAMTLAQADRMVEAVERAGRAVHAVSGPSCGCAMARLKARIDRGEIGDLASCCIRRPLVDCRGLVSTRASRAGSPIPRRCRAARSSTRASTGSTSSAGWPGSEVVEVDARMANLVHKDIAVEDWGMAFFTFANGVRATLEAAWTINAPRATGPSPKQNSVVRLEAIGTRGEIIGPVVPRAGPRRARGRRAPTGSTSASPRSRSRRPRPCRSTT